MRSFGGGVYTYNRTVRGRGVELLELKLPIANSGCLAVQLAQRFGAVRVTLLGYDGQHTGGKTHWHGSHPRGLGDAASLRKWAGCFAELARQVHGLPVVNASRATVHAMFPRAPLEACLA